MTCTCHLHALSRKVAGMTGYDPTRTGLLRQAFIRDVNRRMDGLKEAIRLFVVTKDVLGLGQRTFPHSNLRANDTDFIPPRAYAFMRSDEKLDAFDKWLREEARKNILNPKAGFILMKGPAKEVTGSGRWTDTYIQAGYRKGIANGLTKLKQKGVVMPDRIMGKDVASAAFLSPIHADKIGLLYTRTFNDLRGVTDAMDTAISRSLAESLAEGRDPLQTARIMMSRVDDIGLPRARMIARTEMIRAHAVGAINTYRSAGVAGVTVEAEWGATGDDKVCKKCEALAGRVFTLDAMENLIPLHPNCRCSPLPVVDATQVEEALDEEQAAELMDDIGL